MSSIAQKQRVRSHNREIASRPSLYQEAYDLFRLAESLGDVATMELARRDMAHAIRLEEAYRFGPEGDLLTPAPGLKPSRTFPPVRWIDEVTE